MTGAGGYLPPPVKGRNSSRGLMKTGVRETGGAMNRTVSRVLWVIAGVLLAAAGVVCLCSPGAALTGLSLYLGAAMLVSGVVDLVIYAAA